MLGTGEGNQARGGRQNRLGAVQHKLMADRETGEQEIGSLQMIPKIFKR